MEYLTGTFENTKHGLRRKDDYTRQIAQQGFRIISEQIEQGHVKGGEQCCWAFVCLPGIFLAGRTPGKIIVTYGREEVRSAPLQKIANVRCTVCNAQLLADAKFCESCGANLSVTKPLPEGMKVCPQCAEHILVAARKCRYCGETFASGSLETGEEPKGE
jgi:predicted RNA-binding Zn-ribbon protein involved in translation (DUF1610 family)